MRLQWGAGVALAAVLMAMPAWPQVPGAKHDTKLPIEISSESLEVLQQKSEAIFRGNVIAVQGDMRLKADAMTIHYRPKDGSAPAAAPPAAVGAGAMGAISRIEVDGHVLMATPEESAQGDRGDYDVDHKTIHLFGGNVVLTRAKNILRGTALEYNLATGRSLLTNNGSAVAGQASGGGRVRGVFVPSSDNAQ